MNKQRDKMNSALKENVVPKLREKGFKGSLPHFRRILDKEVHLLTFQFDRNGGGFVIELAKTENKTFESPSGVKIQPNKLTAHDLNERIRIHPKGISETSLTDSWFRYDRFSIGLKNIYKKVSEQVLNQLDLIEEQFLNGKFEI